VNASIFVQAKWKAAFIGYASPAVTGWRKLAVPFLA